jgi:hypothetical protein
VLTLLISFSFFLSSDMTVSVLTPRQREMARMPEPLTDCLMIASLTPGLQAL